MHRHIAALWIFVGRGHACMPSLITGYDNPGGVCKIPDAGILKAVEPIFVAPIQSLADFFPPSAEYLAAWLWHASPHLVAEDTTLARMAEEIYVEHQFKDFVIESHLSVSFVLAVLIPSGLKLKNPYNRLIIRISIVYCGKRGIRTPGGVTLNGFQDRRIRPLCHLSGSVAICDCKVSHCFWIVQYFDALCGVFLIKRLFKNHC